jgi:hypothetical protein
MTKKELIKALEEVPEDTVIICRDEQGGWNNINNVWYDGGTCSIEYGDDLIFTSDKK